MKHVKVSELKARLSAYLREVRSGETIVVMDRLTPIARLVSLELDSEDLSVIEPRRDASELRKLKPVRPRKRVNVVELLRESRDQR
ncbi:MAG TPA: type II toxin-antitoxin system prevent-host-death family antitoxin [Vicinamibacteria bacterium]|nr:type II toxin-antitoxin system prevent-host-death family antitoxin [Vicinamibacteria bacterium]